MAKNAENTVDVVWQLMKRVVLLVVGIYVAFRYGPYVLAHLKSIAVSVLAAVVLTYALLPSVEWLCRAHRGRTKPKTQRLLATTIVFIAFLALVTLGIILMVTPLKEEMSQFSAKVGDYSAEIGMFFERATEWYAEAVPEGVRNLILKLDYSRAAAWLSDYARQLVSLTTSSVGVVVEIVLIPVLAFYFLLDYKTITREFYGLVPAPRRRNALIIGRSVGAIIQSYIFGQIILCAIAGVLTGLFLAAMDMPYVVVLAILSAVTRAIPVIGPVVSGVPIVLVGMLNSDGSAAVPLYLLTFVVVMHFAESKFIMPHLIGERLHLPPAIVIIVLLIGAEFLGILGMFLAAPVAAIVRELVRFYYIHPRKHERAHLEEELEADHITAVG